MQRERNLPNASEGAKMPDMASTITKAELEHLAKLARIELDQKEEKKLLKNLGAMLE
jgi:hypothetical protein